VKEEACCPPTRSTTGRGGWLLPAVFGLLSSTCCTVPLALIALGVGSLPAFFGYVRFAPLVGAAAFVFWLVWRLRARTSGPFGRGLARELGFGVRSAAVFGVVWLVTAFVIAPAVADILWGDSSGSPALTSSALDGSGTDSGPAIVSAFPASAREVTLTIKGMYCPACVAAVKAKLQSNDGVIGAEAWLGGARAVYDANLTSAQELKETATFYAYAAEIESDAAVSGVESQRPGGPAR